jgi:hypothetical protein
MGRPSKLTPEVHAHIVKAIKIGNYAQVAARSAGIGETTFYRWLEQGEAEEAGIYRDFWEAVKEAEAASEMTAVQHILNAMEGSWQAAMTYLERRYSDRWKRRDRQEISNTPNEPYKVLVGVDDSKV